MARVRNNYHCYYIAILESISLEAFPDTLPPAENGRLADCEKRRRREKVCHLRGNKMAISGPSSAPWAAAWYLSLHLSGGGRNLFASVTRLFGRPRFFSSTHPQLRGRLMGIRDGDFAFEPSRALMRRYKSELKNRLFTATESNIEREQELRAIPTPCPFCVEKACEWRYAPRNQT